MPRTDLQSELSVWQIASPKQKGMRAVLSREFREPFLQKRRGFGARFEGYLGI